MQNKWTKVKLLDLCSVKTGKHDANHAVSNGEYRFYTCAAEYSYSDTYVFDEPSIIIPGNGDIGLVFYYEGKFDAYQRTYVLYNIKINPKYLYYQLLFQWRSINANKQFGSTVRYVRMSNFTNYELVMPSILEQERIVAKIEELFSEMDKGVELLQKTKAQLRVYRQAVLKAAFEQYLAIDTIRNMTSLVTSGSRGWAKYYSDSGAKFIRIGNLTRETISIEMNDIQFVLLPDRAEGTRSLLQPYDILVSITADLGSIGFVSEDIGEAYINQHIALVRFNNKTQSEFMAWFLRSERGQKDLLKNKRGGGKLGLGLDDIRNAHVPVVSDEVAIETVSKIESRLSICEKIEQTVDEALLKAESLRQSILKKAFEGELLPYEEEING
jgi:type I restriction enzyme, S subunit